MQLGSKRGSFRWVLYALSILDVCRHQEPWGLHGVFRVPQAYLEALLTLVSRVSKVGYGEDYNRVSRGY